MTQLKDVFVDTNTSLQPSLQTSQTVSIREASSLLEVSPATVRNWQRHGYLSKTSKPHLKSHLTSRLQRQEVLSLKKKLNSGELDRLQKRANKKQASGSFVPDEMIVSASFASELEIILAHIVEYKLPIETSLSVLALKLCVLQQEAVLQDLSNPLDLKNYSNWNRHSLKNEVSLWLQDVKLAKLSIKQKQSCVMLFDLLTDVHQVDVLGIIYQSLLATGEKSKLGSYYTPQDIIIDILENYGDVKGTLLDPCCGTGHFLLTAVRFGYSNPEYLIGFDIDSISVKVARLNMLFAFPQKDFVPRIYNLDTLKASSQQLPENIDLIATNPPWGAVSKTATIADDLFEYVQSGESFSYFLAKCISMLQEGKHLSFVLPESFLSVKQHADIRSFVLESCRVLGIHHLGRRFKGVYTPVIRLDLQKKQADAGTYCEVTLDSQSYKIPQARFVSNQHKCFDSFLSPKDEAILQTFFAQPYTTLEGKADWALGIVTGDNKKHTSSICLDSMEAIITGKEVQPFRLAKAQKFTQFEQGRFQQVAPEYKYRASEKLIYKFISKRLVFAYDDQQHLTLNSANCLIPQLPDMPTKVLLALLNSKPYQFYFEKRFHAHKVLRGDLEALPLLVLSDEVQQKLSTLVDSVLKNPSVKVIPQINTIVYEALQLSKEQIARIEIT